MGATKLSGCGWCDACSYVVASILPEIAQTRSTNELGPTSQKSLPTACDDPVWRRRRSLLEICVWCCRLSEFLGSSSALTDCFTYSNLLLIRSVISDKCGRNTRAKSPTVYRLRVDHARLFHSGLKWLPHRAESELWRVADNPLGRQGRGWSLTGSRSRPGLVA